MKVEFVYTCCRCGLEFRGNNKLFGRAKINVLQIDKESYCYKDGQYLYESICPDCFKELKNWLKGDSLSIDEVKRLHTEIRQLQLQLQASEETKQKLRQECDATRLDVHNYKDQLDWYTEIVDTPRGPCRVSRDSNTVKQAATIINKLLANEEIQKDLTFTEIEGIKKFLEEHNLEETN